MARRSGDLVGPLRISAPVTFGRMHLGPPLYPFLAKNPYIELTLDLDDRRVDAAAEGYDAVVPARPAPGFPAWSPGASHRAGGCSSPRRITFARHKTPATLDDLAGHGGIFYTNRGVEDWRFPGSDGAAIVRGRAALRVNNGDMMRDAALAGIGIALLPTFIIGPDLRVGRLQVIDVGERPAPPELIYVAHLGGAAAHGQAAGLRRLPARGLRRPTLLGALISIRH